MIQFVGDSEFYTNRVAVQVWRSLSGDNKSSSGQAILLLTRVYTGFQRDDERSWLGFHDGISNSESSKRLNFIGIQSQGLRIEERWTANGTYLAYMRIIVDLEKWDKLDPEQAAVNYWQRQADRVPFDADRQKQKVLERSSLSSQRDV